MKFNNEKLKKIVVLGSVICAVLIIIFSIFWAVFAFRSIKGLKKLECSSSRLKSDVVNGFKTDSEIFLGLNGFINFFNTLNSELDSLKNNKNFQKILDEKFLEKTQNLEDKILDHFKTFIGESVTSCTGSGKPIQPNSITTLSFKLSKSIEFEVNRLITSIENLNIGSEEIKNLDSTKIDQFKVSIQSYNSAITSYISLLIRFLITLIRFM